MKNLGKTEKEIDEMGADYFYFEFLKNHDWKYICKNEEMDLWFIEMMISNKVFSFDDFMFNSKVKTEVKMQIIKTLCKVTFPISLPISELENWKGK
jgi:hypothetical protein